MRFTKHLWAGLGLLASLMLIGGTAQATPITVTISAVVSFDGTGLVGVGTPLTVDVFLDDATANEVASPDYLATGGVGSLSSFLIAPVTGTVDQVAGTGSTDWYADGLLDLSALLPGTFLPYSIDISGAGMTAGQIVPDFIGGVTGQVVVDVGAVISGAMVLADVTSVSIVPEPSTALLVGLGLVGLGARRAHRS